MILFVSSKYDPTTDLVIAELSRRGEVYERFNTEDFPRSVICSIEATGNAFEASIDLPDNRHLTVDSVESVYYRRPAESELDPSLSLREARAFALRECRSTVVGLWTVMGCLWVNHPLHNQAAEFKIRQLQVAPEIGFQVPRTLITNDPQKATNFYHQCGENIVAKTLHDGMVEYDDGCLLIFTTRVLEAHLERINSVRYAPCLFQEYIPKLVELRVTVVGDHVFAAEIHSQHSPRTKDDWRRYDFANTPHFPHELPRSVAQMCVRLVRLFGLNYGAIDLILTPDGRYVFLELNPNGQWAWIEELTGLPICSALADLLVTGGRHEDPL